MSDRFEECVKRVLDVEKGWADDPADRGGPTNRGITQRVYVEAIIRKVIPDSVKHRDLTADHARTIYRALYWRAARCDEFPKPLDYCLFDAYVNHRPTVAIKLIQRALRIEDDGRIGPITLTSAQQHRRLSLVVARYVCAREEFYEALVEEDPDQARFIRGWKNRLVTVHKEAMEDLAA